MVLTLGADLQLAWFPDLPGTVRASQVSLRRGQERLPPPYVLFPAGRREAPDHGIAVFARGQPAGELIAVDASGSEHRAAASPGDGLPALLARMSADATVGLLSQLLDTVPRFLRADAAAVAAAALEVAAALDGEPATVSAAFDLGDGETLLRCPAAGAGLTFHQIAADATRPIAGPIDAGGRGEYWVLPAIGHGATGPHLLAGLARGSAWRVRLDRLEPLPATALQRYLGHLGADAAASLVLALQRWQSSRPVRSARIAALIADCDALYGFRPTGAGRLTGGIDALVPTPDGAALVVGWLFDPDRRVAAVEAVDCTGRHLRLPALWPVVHATAAARWRDAGLTVPERAGFVGLAEGGTDGPWSVEIVLQSGFRLPLAVPPPDAEPRRRRDRLLTALPASATIDGALAQAIAPAAERLQAVCMAAHPPASRVGARVAIGRHPAPPRASIVIPLYRNLNFLGFQWAAFGTDPGLADVEIVYVLDSPEQAEFLEGRLRGEHLIYRRPVTMIVHAANLGFAAAANTGARAASGEALVFLNSDVVPERAGWLDPLLAGLERPGIGAVGGQLLYMDDSLQFAGLYFDRDADGVWFNRHIAKGYPRSHPPANRARTVPALTGACLAIRRSTFDRAGGFDEGYVIGDFEDSDLCLRLSAEGLGCWYEPASALYHIERQSIDRHQAHGKSVATMVNRWRQHRRWDAEITALMAGRGDRWGLPASLVPEIERTR